MDKIEKLIDKKLMNVREVVNQHSKVIKQLLTQINILKDQIASLKSKLAAKEFLDEQAKTVDNPFKDIFK